MEKHQKIAVSAIEVPWRNVECIGVFDSIEEANAAAEKHIREYAGITGEDYVYEPISSLGRTYGTVKGNDDDGYEFLFLGYSEGDELYVLREDWDGDELLGPYKSLDEANEKALPPDADQKFEIVPGTMGSGCYVVEIEADDDGSYVRYTPIFIYE